MKRRLMRMCLASCIGLFLTTGLFTIAGETTAKKATGPLKVYILAGQSNMQGQAKERTLPHMALPPETKPLYDKLVDETGTPRVHKDIYITAISFDSSWGGTNPTAKAGLLSVGYGKGLDFDTALGPELAFGVTMQESVGEPILLIKTAWGGKSLIRDFRPPSAGEYPAPEDKQKKWEEAGTVEAEMNAWNEGNGRFYRMMMKHVKSVLADPGKYCAAYDPKQGWEVAGFAWFQGFNDMVGPYPKADSNDRKSPKDYSEYSRLLGCLIRDVRSELNAPKMPFVIGVMGIDGKPDEPHPFREAMAAPAELPEFKGNVVAVHTARFWDDELVAASKKAGELNRFKNTPYTLTETGALVKKSTADPGWEPLGTPALAERQWRYTTFETDPEGHYRDLREGEPGDERFFVEKVPEEYQDWQNPGFDDCTWQKGVAPIGKGTFYQDRKTKVEAPEVHSKWGDGNMMLMRTTVELDSLDYEKFRLCIMARRSYNIYLNGHKVATYVWWKKGGNSYRSFELSKEQTAYLKKGANTLAVQANGAVNNKDGSFNWVDLMIEGITAEGMKNEQKLYDGICSPKEREIAKGVSNAAYHYMGSAKIYSRIGEALAKALVVAGGAEK